VWTAKAKRGGGRPPGSKNKVASRRATRAVSTEAKRNQVYNGNVLADGAERWRQRLLTTLQLGYLLGKRKRAAASWCAVSGRCDGGHRASGCS
jgi:hypothetical protein